MTKTPNQTWPKITHYARIDPSQYIRQNWRYAFKMQIPLDVMTSTLAAGMPEEVLGQWLSSPEEEFSTVLIPYLQEQEVVRPAAVNIVPTIGGEKHVEDRGRIRETQTISGISGFLAAAPPPSSAFQKYHSDILNAFGNFIDPTGSIKQKGLRSGYAWFHRFANLFDAYWHIKRTAPPADAKKVRMIWMNERDDEFYEIVPINFRYRRSVPAGKFQYAWSVTFEVLEEFGKSGTVLENVTTKPQPDMFSAVRNIMDRINRLMNAIIVTAQTMMAALLTFLNELFNVFSFLAQTINSLTSTVSWVFDTIGGQIRKGLGVLDSLVSALSRIVGLGQMHRTNQSYIALNEIVIASYTTFAQISERLASLDQKSYPDFFTELTTKGLGTRPTGSLNKQADIGMRQQTLLGAEAQSSADVSNFFRSPYTSGLPLIPTNPSDRDGMNSLGWYDNTKDRSNWTGTRDVVVHPGDDIFKIARRELGSVEFAVDLIQLNQLIAPYISTTYEAPKGVLRYGDRIKVPTARNTMGPDTSYVSSLLSFPQATGYASSGSTSDYLFDSTRSLLGYRWQEDQWRGATLTILSGTNQAERSTVLKNTQDTVYVRLDGQLAHALNVGSVVFYARSQDVLYVPDSTPVKVVFDLGLPTEETNFITDIQSNKIYLRDAVGYTHAAGSDFVVGTPFTTSLDTTSEYLLAFNQVQTATTQTGSQFASGLDIRVQKKFSGGKYAAIWGQDGDVDLVAGIEECAQSLQIVFETEIGGNPFLPNDGVAKLIGRKATPTNLFLIKLFGRQAILSDPRAVDIIAENVVLDGQNNVIQIDFVITTVFGSTDTITVRD